MDDSHQWMRIMNQALSYFAGQKVEGNGVKKLILSPLPIATNFKKAHSARSILKRNYTYIDVGGRVANVSLGLTLSAYLAFGLILSLLIYAFVGDFTPQIKEHVVRDIYGVDVVLKTEYAGFIMSMLMMFLPLIFMLMICLSSIIREMKLAKRSTAFRFHRQRREVAMCQWDEDLLKVVVTYQPWEAMFAWVEDKNARLATAAPAKSVLVIGGTRESMVGSQWVCQTIPALDKESAVMEWEAIRSFMEDGVREDSELTDHPPKMTMQRVMEDYCITSKQPMTIFTQKKRLWWAISGRRLGVLLYNFMMRVERQQDVVDPTFEAWSLPLSDCDSQQPSAALKKYNMWLKRNEYAKGLNIQTIGDVKDKYSL
ncbi:hypothetical protein JCM19237_6421 [Photobacterium aphoticum]|uniref:Uncharacterized protein n=1 Tax=Photobacterium aphoticum TaxID=754436 RepID=A0A090R7E2_9GAMM|nr:hypothetical protein JCM19237_6421 [Photobacterium aphoticum]